MKKLLIAAFITSTSFSAHSVTNESEVLKPFGTIDCPTNIYYSKQDLCFKSTDSGIEAYSSDIDPIVVVPTDPINPTNPPTRGDVKDLIVNNMYEAIKELQINATNEEKVDKFNAFMNTIGADISLEYAATLSAGVMVIANGHLVGTITADNLDQVLQNASNNQEARSDEREQGVPVTPPDPNNEIIIDPILEPVDPPPSYGVIIDPIKENTDLNMDWKAPLKILDPRDLKGWESLYDLAETNEAKALVQEMFEYVERWASKDGDKDAGRSMDEIMDDIKVLVNNLPTARKVLTLATLNNLSMNHDGKYDSMLHQLMSGFGYGNATQLKRLEKFNTLRATGGLKDYIAQKKETIKEKHNQRKANRGSSTKRDSKATRTNNRATRAGYDGSNVRR